MARPAADVATPRPREILRLLAPFPGRAAIAVRVALICALTVLVASTYGTPEAATSVYIVFFLTKPDRVTSALTAVALLVLITVLIGLIFPIAMFCIDYPLLRVACIATTSFGLLYLTSASKLRPVGPILAMIVGFTLDMLGSIPGGEAATRALLYAWLMVAIPVAVAVPIHLLIAPSPRRLAGEKLAQRLRLAAAVLRGDDDAARAPFAACLREGNGQLATWLKLSKLEGTSSVADLVALKQAAAASVAILVAADFAGREPGARLPAAFAEPIAATLDEMAAMLAQRGYPVDIALALPATDALPPLARAVVSDLRDAITGFTVADAAQTSQTAQTAATPSPARPPAVPAASAPAAKPKGGFLLPDAHTNPDHVRYALKTTVAAMFCYLLYQQLDWSGIHTCFITCYMVSLGTTAETVEKLTLRITGCLVGALLGTAAIVFVVPSLTSIGGLMVLVFACGALAAWVAFGSPRIAYAGFQISFALFMCVIQGASPAFDLTLARDRVIGILLGNLVVYLVFTRIWPVSIARQLDASLAALFEQWRKLTRLAEPAERRALAAEALAQHHAIAQNVGLTDYEPSWVRPAPAWLAARRYALDAVRALEGPMFLLAERSPGDAAIGERLARVSRVAEAAGIGQAAGTAGAEDDGMRAAPPPTDADAPRAALLNLIDARLSRISEDVPMDVSKEPLPHAST
jgi:multidrug resistance protein MdtO